MTNCTGLEQHEHYIIGTNQTILHRHEHSVVTEDFNRLHHHPPVEHNNFTAEELAADVVFITKTPY